MTDHTASQPCATRLPGLMLVAALMVATPRPADAGHGFFSPAPGSSGGRVVTAVSASDGKLWALSGGALYSAIDGGRAWRLVNAGAGGAALWIDPRDGETLVTYTEGFAVSNLSISRDGGKSFTRLQTPSDRMRHFRPTSSGWFALFWTQTSPTFQLHRSFDFGATWEAVAHLAHFLEADHDGISLLLWTSGGILTSSDGGETAEQALVSEPLDHFEDLAISPTSPNRVLVVSREGRIYRSQDGGHSFTQSMLAGEEDIWGASILWHPANPELVVAAFSHPGGSTFHRSSDGGATWDRRHVLDDPPRFLQLVPDPCDRQTIYAYDRDQESFLGSKDFGQSWQSLSSQPPAIGSFRIHDVTPVAQACRLIASTSLGLAASTDGGETWRPWQRGLRAGIFLQVAFDPNVPHRVFAAGVGLARSDDGGRGWQVLDNELTGLEVRNLLIHPDGTLLASGSASYPAGTHLFRSTDGGQTFDQVVVASQDFLAAVAVDPSDPDHVVSSGWEIGILESRDFGRTWTTLGEDSEAPNDSLLIHPEDPSVMWGIRTSSVVRSVDGGRSWEELHLDISPRWVKIHPQTGELWAGGGEFGILRSPDDGQSWTYLGQHGRWLLSDLAFDSRDPATLYFTRWSSPGDAPILRSTDDGATWQSWNEGFAPLAAGRLVQDPADPEHWLLAGPEGMHWRDERSAPACPSYRQQSLCLDDGRFEVSVDWLDFTGRRGRADLVGFQTGESGLFTFFDPDNWEVMVKVLDGCGVNQHFWVFGAGITNVDFTLHVTDRQTGRYRQYFNFLGENAPAVTDTTAFPCAHQPASTDPSAIPAQVADTLVTAPGTTQCGTAEAPALCLGPGGRYRVDVRWRDFADRRGAGQPVPFSTPDSGLFTFFGADNWEVMVKVLDGCDFNDRFWVFAGATTNVEFDLEVTDQLTGQVRAYHNPLGRSAEAIVDTDAFACPDS